MEQSQTNVRDLTPAFRPTRDFYTQSLERLISVVQDLSLARGLPEVMDIVRHAARQLTGADGATFVLRDKDYCFYAEEDAIGPLWKGKKFSMSICISGWVMLNRAPVFLDNVFNDPRIPADIYRQTFVKSMAMVPIRRQDPIGAIGIYWAQFRTPSEEEIKILGALADATSVTLENLGLYSKLNSRVEELEIARREMERFAWATSHDLREPLRNIATYSQLLERKYGDKLGEEGKQYLNFSISAAKRFQKLLTELLAYLQTDKNGAEWIFESLAKDCESGWVNLKAEVEAAGAKIFLNNLPSVEANHVLIVQLFQNLFSNSIKFRSRDRPPIIEVYGRENLRDWEISVTDNGIGIPESHAERIFEFFERLHTKNKYEGSGIGLALCRKIVRAHGGNIRVESKEGPGSRFVFTLPKPEGT